MTEITKFNRYRQLKLSQPIELSEISRLYSLEPIGLETPFTESLSSYLLRLAEAHCVVPKKLIMGEIAPLVLGDRYTSKIASKGVSALLPNCDAKPGINGMRAMTTVIANALEELTLREDLGFLSLITWKGIIEEQKLFRSKKAICPQCFEEWKLQQKIIYEPLLWSF
ncbi:MAG: TniQ family protein [Pleurocapsa sp. MO_192.B19]|nr:TniQ family protein [Pleurocapsa sp. MO_192.B19]